MRILILISVSVFALSSCTKDKTAPAIYSPTFGADAAFYSGDSIPLSLTFVDNKDLDRLEFEISPDDPDEIPSTVTLPFYYSGEAIANGNTVFIEEIIPVPDSAATGDYNMLVTGYDQAGNTTSQTFNFKVINSLDASAPELVKVNIADTVSASLFTTIKATALDNTALAEVKVRLVQNATSEEILFQTFLPVEGLFQIEQLLNFPIEGRYTFSIELRDWANNSATYDYIISVI